MFSFNRLLIPAAVGASLLVAGCGGSSNSPVGGATPPVSQSSSGPSAALRIGTASDSLGTYLTGASGRALYIWVADPTGRSSCSGACAQAWPPLTASSLPKVGGGVKASNISLISRSSGAKQVAYNGRPLYYYAGDSGSGMTNGQGSDQFGAKWWLISPSGGQISSSSSQGSSGGGAYGAGAGGGSSSSSGGGSSSSSGAGWG